MSDPKLAPTIENFLTLPLEDELATKALGTALAAGLESGLRIYLHGPLGAGKTTLVRAVLAALGHRGRVKSPTYTLVELYALSRLNLYHFDFYRFRDTNEWRDAGFSEYFGNDSVCLVEWPEKAGDDLPLADLDIALEVVSSKEHDPSPISLSSIQGLDAHATTLGATELDAIRMDSTARRALLRAHSPAGQRCLGNAAHLKSQGASS